MRRFQVSQAAIDRCFDELAWQGLVRREPGKGIFVDGYIPQNRLIGVCGNRLATDAINTSFFKGFMAAARAADFTAVDFGPTDGADLHQRILPHLETGGFAGLALNVSGITADEIAGSPTLLQSLSGSKIPKVLTHPIPAIWADSVGGDDFHAYRQMGEQLVNPHLPVLFLGRPAPRVLARWQGLSAGIKPAGPILACFDPAEWKNRIEGDGATPWNGHLVMGCVDPAFTLWLVHSRPRPAPAKTFLLVGDEEPTPPSDARTRVWTCSATAMGARAAELLIRRIRRPRIPLLHEISPLHPPPDGAA
jgi:hypothetical protein